MKKISQLSFLLALLVCLAGCTSLSHAPDTAPSVANKRTVVTLEASKNSYFFGELIHVVEAITNNNYRDVMIEPSHFLELKEVRRHDKGQILSLSEPALGGGWGPGPEDIPARGKLNYEHICSTTKIDPSWIPSVDISEEGTYVLVFKNERGLTKSVVVKIRKPTEEYLVSITKKKEMLSASELGVLYSNNQDKAYVYLKKLAELLWNLSDKNKLRQMKGSVHGFIPPDNKFGFKAGAKGRKWFRETSERNFSKRTVVGYLTLLQTDTGKLKELVRCLLRRFQGKESETLLGAMARVDEFEMDECFGKTDLQPEKNEDDIDKKSPNKQIQPTAKKRGG